MSKYNRRDILKLLGGFTGASLINSPLGILYKSCLDGIFTQALAEQTGALPKRYVTIMEDNAPSRWVFDLFLTPYSSDGFVNNPHVGTRYTNTGGRFQSVRHQTILRKGINVPWLWQFDVPKAGGGTRPMTDLLDNMLSLQGITTKNAGHPKSQEMHYLPLGASRSLMALAADPSSNPFAAVNLSKSEAFRFKSSNSKSAVNAGGTGNLLEKLLNPFNTNLPSDYLTKADSLSGVMDDAFSALNKLAKSEGAGGRQVATNVEGAKQLLNNGANDLASKWTQLLGKYEDLITRAISGSPNLAGISNNPVGSTDTASRGAEYNLNSENNRVGIADLRSMITTNSTIGNLAAHFATAEYVLKNNLSRTVALQLGAFDGLGGGAPANRLGKDEHNSGRMVVTLLNSYRYRAIAACLLELIDVLKAAGMYADTVIDLSGDFNRSPRSDGSGSDHGWQGKTVSLFSGALTGGPTVLGNLKTITNGDYTGTWGHGGTVAALGRQLGLNDMAATIAHLLGAPSPLTSAQSIVQLNQGTLTPLIEKTRIVA